MAEVKHNFDELRDLALPQFPRAMYHDSFPAVVVSGPEELKGLGPGWRDHPDKAYAKIKTGEEETKAEAKAEEEAPEESEITATGDTISVTRRRGRPPKGY
jgi:hypothetical protein